MIMTSTTTTSTTVLVRYFAAARSAAGSGEEHLVLPTGSTVEQAVAAIGSKYGDAMTQILLRCSYLLDEVAVGRQIQRRVHDGSTLDVLPPFAGG
jgi:sulfur-carrier protein